MTALPRFVLHAHVCTFTYYILHSFACFWSYHHCETWLLSCRNVGSCRLQCQVPWVLNVLDSSKTELSTLTKNKKRCLNQTYWIKVQLLYQYLSISHSCLVFFFCSFLLFILFTLSAYLCMYIFACIVQPNSVNLDIKPLFSIFIYVHINHSCIE